MDHEWEWYGLNLPVPPQFGDHQSVGELASLYVDHDINRETPEQQLSMDFK